MINDDIVLAADIGGTHVTAALVDLAERRIIPSSLIRRHVDANGSVEEIITAWSEAFTDAMAGKHVDKICLAMPGPFDYEEGISQMQGQGKYDALYGADVRQLLATSLQISPEALFFENDAACYLQGEVFAGAANDDYEKVIGVTLGTGLGTAIYQHGRSHSANLWSLPFNESIAEEYLATRWFVKRYSALTGNIISGAKQLADMAVSNATAQSVFCEFGKNLALFLNDFIQMETPQAVVVGGNIAKAYKLFAKELEEDLAKLHPGIDLKASLLGEEAALLGAAGSWHSAMLHKEVPSKL